jgi:hypothetical protein
MRFDPPLSRWEKRIGWAWMITGGTAVAAMTMGVFPWWGLLIVTIPVLIYALIAPGLFLYMSAVIVPLLLTRRRYRRAGWAAALLLVAGLAVWPPWQSQRETAAALDFAVAVDRGDKLALPRGGTLALLSGMETCSVSCIEALRDHGVAAVLIGDGRTDPLGAATLPRARLVPAGGQPCPPLGQTARQLDWVWPEQAKELAAAGLCVVVDTAPLASADLVMRFFYDFEDTPFRTVQVTRIEAWHWQDGRRQDARLQPVLRRTQARASHVLYPAFYLAPMVADNGTSPANWWSEGQQRGPDLSDDLSAWWQKPA